jgi:phospholipid-binding lipoprotein MlaA
VIGRWLRVSVAAVLLAGAAGCATTGGDPRDPLEGFNRAMYSFNEGFDQAIGKPVAGAYRDFVPPPVRTWVRNFFSNVADLFIGVNNLLQGKPAEAANDWVRFMFNTSFGFFGIGDIASDLGYEKHDEDFGQTFGRWGVGDGPYIVWPFLGASTARDSVGLIPDYYFDPVARHNPVRERNAMGLLRVTSKRADLLDASRILEEAALDKYVFQRDAYLQRRRSQIHDGSPPRAERESLRVETDEAAPAAQAAPAASPAAQDPAPAPAAVGAAARLLEEPAASVAVRGS